MKRIFINALLLLTISLPAIAQKTGKGKVIDAATGNTLSGATVSMTGKTGTTSDKDGAFSFDCEKTNKITVSFIGYNAQVVSIKNCDEFLIVSLVRADNYLNNVEISVTSSQDKSLLSQPVSITKLGRTELKRGHGLYFDDVIQTSVPGVIMNRRSVSGGQQFNIRGYGNGSRGTRGISSNFDGQGYKVYLNGIPITDAEGINTLDDIDFGSIANVEIVKGPAGTLYGQAIAGAINFKIAAPEKGRTSVAQNIMVGNLGLLRSTTQLAATAEHSNIFLTYGRQKTDGFTIHNKSHKDFVNFAGDFQLNPKQMLTSFVGFTDSYDERMGELSQTQYYSKDYTGNIEYKKRDAHSHVTTFRAGLSHTYNFCTAVSNTTTIFGTGFRSDAASGGGWTDKNSVNYGFRSSFNTRFLVGSGTSLNGITGIEVQKQDAHIIGYNMKQNPNDLSVTPWDFGKPYWVVNAMTSNTAFVTIPTAYFTEWTLALQHGLSFTGGIGLSTQRIILDDRFNPATATKPSHFDTSYKNMWSPHLAINKIFNKGFSVYASYSVGYKAPISSYFFIATPQVGTPPNPGSAPATTRVNEVLKPEKGTQFEVGSKGRLLKDRLVYQLSLFSLEFSDKMTSVAVPVPTTTPPPTATAYSYVVNGGEQNHKGIEASLNYSIVKDDAGIFTNVTPFINVTYSDFKYGDNFIFRTGATTSVFDTLDYSGLNVFGTPKLMSAIGIDLTMKNGIYASLSHLYNDGTNFALEKTSSSPKVFTLRKSSSYNLLNGKIGFRKNLSAHFDLDTYFGVNNITSVQYPIMVFVNQLPDAYVPAPLKAVIYGGLNLKYIF